MAKYYGNIGYTTTVETSPGVWEDQATERPYFGDVSSMTIRRQEVNDKVNADLNVHNVISIVADPYAYRNFGSIRYIWWQGVRWTINSVEVKSPRLILTIGGVYNGPENNPSDDTGGDNG